MNKKGFGALLGIFIGLVIFIILAFIIAVGGGLFMKVSSTLTDSVVSSSPESLNFKNTTMVTAGNANAAVQQLSFFTWILIIAMVLGVLIAAYMIIPSGMTIFFWFLMSAGIFTASVYLSRAYEDLYNSAGFVGTALHLTDRGTSWLIIYMPAVITLLAFIGGIILYIRLKKKEEDII